MLAKHQQWMATSGKQGSQGVLDRQDLSGADLRKADLRGASLNCAILRHADLSGADLRDLDADHPTSMRGTDFGGADLRDARLPVSKCSLEDIDNVTEACKNCRQLLVVLIAAAAYALLTMAATSDADLVTGSAVLPLPVLADVRVPTRLFYTLGPLILLGSFIHLHLYLCGLWRMVTVIPARFRDGATLDARIYPWLVMSIVAARFPRLRAEARRPAVGLGRWMSTLVVWWGIPAVLFVFWVAYLPRRDLWGTFVQVCAIGLALAWALLSLWHTGRTLDTGYGEGNFVTAPFRRQSVFTWISAAVPAVILGLIVYGSWGTIHGELVS